MERHTDKEPGEGSRPRSASNRSQPGHGAPLVIVSERGRHSDEARRVVRAQAARASAAQSRVTRARNREEREGMIREGPQSPASEGHTSPVEPEASESAAIPSIGPWQTPLVTWLASVLNVSPVSLIGNAQTTLSSSLTAATNALSPGVGALLGYSSTNDPSRPQLPRAMPRGFGTLQQRIEISDGLMVLLSMTACFDYGSPGVEQRLHQLLFDLIIGHVGAVLSTVPIPGHPIQSHLRIACTCLTIFQGQRVDGAAFDESTYQQGLIAAGSEAMLLDQNTLAEPKSAEASLWAVFIISVTTRSTADFFHNLLHNLFQDLQLQYWSQVRSILLDFIYPVSFLDEPCRLFYDHLKQHQNGMT